MYADNDGGVQIKEAGIIFLTLSVPLLLLL